jgi:hypothetical protein
MADDTGSQRVSLSVEVLRAETRAANAELRDELKTYIGGQMEPLRRDQERFARGEFTQAQTRSIDALIDGSFSKRAKAGFSTRERRIAAVGLLVAVISMTSAVFIGVHTLLLG